MLIVYIVLLFQIVMAQVGSHGTTFKPQRILIVGGSGEGKSSLINLLCDERKAETHSGAIGCTFQCADHIVQYKNSAYLLTDTVGFNEPDAGGKVSHRDAIKCLVNFAKTHEDGFNLIVFVMRRGRITKSFKETYEFFYQVLFSQEVPCVLYLSGSEYDDNMDEWFKHNKSHFEESFRFLQVVSGTTMVHLNPNLETFLAPKRAETRKKVWETIQYFARPESFRMMTGVNFWRRALNAVYYYFTFGGTLFKSQAKADIEKQLYSMQIDQKTINEIMTMIE